MAKPKNCDRGFAMVEVLVSIAIILVGLLGLAGLQARAQEAEMESYQRAQALVLLQDMVDRINANRQTAPCYAITTGVGTPFLGSGAGVVIGCVGFGDANSQARADADMTDWQNSLLGASETLGGNSVGAMIGARGCITQTDPVNDIYTIAVAWQGLTDTAAPAVACGNGLYGNETRRRVVWTTLQIADLT
ncbi:MAG: type IV pilus modification protein PilV [Gammaproteobacteria bacterium]